MDSPRNAFSLNVMVLSVILLNMISWELIPERWKAAGAVARKMSLVSRELERRFPRSPAPRQPLCAAQVLKQRARAEAG